MAEVGLINPSLIDVMNNTNADGSIVKIVETMEQMSPILRHANYQECNNGSKHKTTVRTGIPTPAFRRYNQGVQPSNTQEVPIEDTTGMIEDYLEVDKALADLSGNQKQFRANKAKGIMQGFNNFVASEMFYGSPALTPEGFMGLAPRYCMLPTNDKATAAARQVIDGGGTGSNNASIWFMTWSETATQLLYPRGSKVGLHHEDKGARTKDMDGGKKMEIYEDHFKWDIGLTDQDWRANARICNIDVAALTKDAATGADLLDLMIDADETLDQAATAGGKTCIYVGRTIAAFLRKQALSKAAGNLRIDEVAGRKVTMWGEHEVARIDALLETEARVV
jgi:hypothetical protein